MVFRYAYDFATSYYAGGPPGPDAATKTARKRHTYPGRTPAAGANASHRSSPYRRERRDTDGNPFIIAECDEEKYLLVDEICDQHDLYKVLGVSRTCRHEDLRRAYIGRSRVVHPDKFPHYPDSTAAFQKLSLAYETLSKPASRKLYDLSGRAEGVTTSADGGLGDETLRSVLATVFRELLEGDLAIIRVLITALNDGNPGLNLGEDAIEGLENVFARMRGLVLSSQKYFRVIRFELIRLYEIQSQLRSLSYFDIRGRLRLTLQLWVTDRSLAKGIARLTAHRGIVALSIPMAIDQAIGADPAEPTMTEEDGKEVVRRSLLGPRLAGALALAVSLLERGERVV